MLKEEFEKWETDVLIVGGGSAGLRAALAARETGARVLVVNRGGKTYGGATSYLDKLIEVTGLAVALNKEDSDLYYKELYDFGMKVNSRELVRTFTDNSEKELRFLESIGVEFERQGNEYVWMQIPSHSRPRVVKGMSDFGTEILTRLVKACEEKGVQFLAHTGIYEIIKDSSGHPRWALGIHKTQKCTQPVQIRFSSVIIATGGFGNLFSYATNPQGNASGMAIGLDLGAALTNLEFMHILPLFVSPIRGFYMISALLSQGKILNTAKEPFSSGWDHSSQEPDTVTQGNITFEICKWIEKQQEMGKATSDGGVYWYGTHLIDVMKHRIPRSLEMLKARNLDLTSQPAIISSGCHQALGGIAINPQGETGVAGLFACGECAGGFQGAQRMMGTGVMDALVFGSRAGRAAAEAIGQPGTKHWVVMSEDVNRTPELTCDKGFRQLHASMDRILVTKNKEKLRRAQMEVESLQKSLEHYPLNAIPYKDRLRYSELKHAVSIAQAFIASSQAREESRGSFVRSDFPDQSQHFDKQSFVHRIQPDQFQVAFHS
ncbi:MULTISPECIES: FAD-dependent oxidoreductase [Paenibacillus]|uniref:L-aspartate oxidase n=1 Tax=Paenibacillus naphthalenovorans TaxID=162209 RepID=A0A0U2WI59_9BACL|nr:MULTISPECIES: FAD-dependent oxidoreductase [Paenibacillus]ALS24986.1 L-aspartate oxidase [Paenibacillus naphthalenovorans]NTZ19143.1 FAD-dependent oxidoreductase [Paenibacillus sp. JMULE4]GCL74084.1 hypothetical protein PN4B1_40260 [Paenibacillus naphthalenovorans]